MNIGILDGDLLKRGKRGVYPNLALMKLSSYHKNKGDKVEMVNELSSYDKVYCSKVFTFGKSPLDRDYALNTNKIETGGGFFDLHKTLPDEIEHSRPDYLLYNVKNTAYGFTTRGCIRKCGFCIVPKKEGYIKPHAEIEEFWSDGQDLILMDNNILAHEHGIKQIEKIVKLEIKTDFNQGLDARLCDEDLIKLLCKVKRLTNYLRFAFDNMSEYKPLQNISKWMLKATGRHRIQSMTSVYCLIDEFYDSYNRLCLLKELDMCPSPQIVMDLKTGERKANLGNWMLYQWAAMPAVFDRPFEDFKYKGFTGKDILESYELRNRPKTDFIKNKE